MAYELRIKGRAVDRFASTEDALARVRQELATDPDCEPELVDTETNRPFGPAASRSWREHFANEVGF